MNILNNNRIKYDLATNFDTVLLDHIKKVDTNHQVVSVFGKLKNDIIGGGRSSITLPKVNMKQLKEYIDRCNKIGIKFNYLLNPLCLGNKDVVASEHKKILKYIAKLVDLGVESVTVNSPYLCEIIKKQFPNIKITIGLYAIINTLQQARQWIELGANELTLWHHLNRDFDGLRAMLKAFKNKNVNLRVIANNGCLHDCPFYINHGTGVSHSSQSSHKSVGTYIDYNIVNCFYRKVTKPTNFISSDWIRPEDVHYYQDLCRETGNYNFSIKLVDRSKSTEFLTNVLDAYISEKYDGNLHQLLNFVDKDHEPKIDKKGFYKGVLLRNLNLDTLMRYGNFFKLPEIFIDNNKLDGFIEHFIKNNQCKNKICWLENYNPEKYSDKYCYYCYKWSKKSITYKDDQTRKEWIEGAESLKDDLVSSRVFRVKNY